MLMPADASRKSDFVMSGLGELLDENVSDLSALKIGGW